MSEVSVSVIIVFRNESKYIESCIDSVLTQFTSADTWELIFVNSNSDDNTIKLINDKLRSLNIRFRIFDNPGRTLAKGWNIGIKNANGRFIIRPDAHATLGSGYIFKAISILNEKPEVGVVGGMLHTKAKSFTGKLIKSALSMKSGVGNSSFRTGSHSGYKDTAVYGVYRKEVYDRVGLMNEKLARHQDTDFHKRIIKNGYKIYMNNEISSDYYCRDSFSALGKQMFEIGFYFSYLIEENAADSLRPRHWIPMFFYLGLFILLILGNWYKMLLWLFCLSVIIYLTIIAIDIIFKIIKKGSLYPLASILIIPFIHFMYAAGTFTGLFSFLIRKKSDERN